jgi:hypothetical protein
MAWKIMSIPYLLYEEWHCGTSYVPISHACITATSEMMTEVKNAQSKCFIMSIIDWTTGQHKAS